MSFTLGYFYQTIYSFFKKYSALEIYTDGSCKDGFGSWSYIISRRGKIICERAGSVQGTSSNTMEFQAALEALSSLSVKSTITIFSDSKILVDAMTFGKSHTSFQNQMEQLKPLIYKHKVKWQWIKAHNGNKFNERCDELCTLIRGN